MLAAPESRRQSAGRKPRMAFSAPTGHTALLEMLASCAQGVTVMGIDNGF
jgi:hypothetical protein